MLSGISHLTQPVEEVQLGEVLVELHLHNFVISTASGALVVGGVRDIVVVVLSGDRFECSME